MLVTGAARGIGAESARQLARRGARLVLAGLEPERLEAVAAECGPEAIWVEADVTDSDQVERAVAAGVERFGGIDVAIANAGIARLGTVEGMPPEDFEATIEVNLLGVWRTVRAALPHVIERSGYVLSVASLAAAVYAPLLAPYSASKAGVEGFMSSMASEVAPYGVRVGVAYFGYIDTDMVSEGVEHPAGAFLRERTPPLFTLRTVPVEVAGRAVARGVERRARRVVAPRDIWPLLLVPQPILQALFDRQVRRSGVAEAVRLANEHSRQKLRA